MSIVDEAFAALRPEQWSAAHAPTADPRAEVRRRIQAGACPACGLRPHAPRRVLCADCHGAGHRYCARCETIKDAPLFPSRGSWCRACQNEWRRLRRGVDSPKEARRRMRSGGRKGGAALRARTAAQNAEIARLRAAGLSWPVIARQVGLPSRNVARNRYWRLMKRRFDRRREEAT